MTFDSNGTFNRLRSWKSDAAAGIKIRADYHDDEDDGFAAGLSNCITKDGRTQPLADIPMNNKKITNLGEPSGPSDAATKNYVDNFKDFSTGLKINGAGPINGFINFTSPTGINGIGWTTADMSWVGKVAEASKTRKRLAVNDKPDGTGSDVCIIDEGGFINTAGYVTNNLSYDGAAWRTIAAGTGTLLQYSSGAFNVYSNDVATTSAYQLNTPRNFATISNGAGTVSLALRKSASAKAVQILSYTGTELRWNMQLGNGTAETSTRTGSDFVLTSYDNAGAGAHTEMSIIRATHAVNFYGALTTTGTITSGSNFDSTSTTCIVSATNGGAIYLRPDGPTVGTSGMYVNTNGEVAICEAALAATGGLLGGKGIRCKVGSNGGYGSSYHNFYWDGTYVRSYIDNTLIGYIAWQCDYRIKKDIQPLPSMWNAVKALNPIKYTQKAYDIWVNDDTERWGFVAHELQEKMGKATATGDKDGPDIQSPNLLAIIAGLTKALQEAMSRIEALEAKA